MINENARCGFTDSVSFLLSALLGKLLIPLLKKVKVRQTVREDGPSTHLCKSGTPTMGGIIILLSILLSTLPFLHRFPEDTGIVCNVRIRTDRLLR